jgi:hypothetical protein
VISGVHPSGPSLGDLPAFPGWHGGAGPGLPGTLCCCDLFGESVSLIWMTDLKPSFSVAFLVMQ